jgi:hypothetical protein
MDLLLSQIFKDFIRRVYNRERVLNIGSGVFVILARANYVVKFRMSIHIYSLPKGLDKRNA